MSKTIIFDFDGTIADTLESMVKLFNQISGDFSLPQITPADKIKLRDLSIKELMTKYKISTFQFLKLNQRILAKLKNNISKIKPIPGMVELLVKLKNNGYNLGIVSSNSKENIELFLLKHNIKDIDFIYSEKNLFGKDKVLKHLLKAKGLAKQDVVYVGDEVRDIEASQKTGIAVMAVTWGFNSAVRLGRAQPTYIINSPAEILEKIILLSNN